MSLNWITEKELNEIPFDAFLLLEECQLNWIDEERYADAWGLALRAHPYVVWAIAKRAPQKAAWAERMLKHGKALPPADTQALFQAERTLLRAYEDWIAYAVNPEIYHRQPFLQWDERELTGLCDFAGKRVVDVGSGTGKQAFAVAPLCKAVYCVEPAWSLRRFLRERAEREHVKNLNEMMGGILPKQKKRRRVNVREARRILTQEESEKLIDMDDVIREAIDKAEQDGIIFIDEIDKIAGAQHGSGPDVSREGVQRDILPIVEGCTVNTKYGPVKTDFILFIAAGAFHVSKVSDLIPELQGRFPIRVKLSALTEQDYERILSQPEHAITKQYAALLETDNVALQFTDGALSAIAHYACRANESSENIGARRLHTIMETVLDDISFNASGEHPLVKVIVDENYVKEHLSDEFDGEDLEKFIL